MRSLMNWLLAACTCVCALAAEPAAATVNGEPVYVREVADLSLRRHGDEALKELITRKVICQAMRKAAYQPDAEGLAFAVDEEERNIREAYGADATLDKMAWQQLGMSRQQYIEQVIKARLFLRRLATGGQQPKETELIRHYSQYKERFMEPARTRISHIFFAGVDGGGREQSAKARQAAIEARRLLDKGRDFGEVARRLSEDKESARVGGDLGYIEWRNFRWGPQVAQAAEEAAVAAVVGPVESLFGYHILKVTDRIPGYLPAYERVRSLVLADYLDDKAQLEGQLLVTRMLEEADIKNLLADYLAATPDTAGKETGR